MRKAIEKSKALLAELQPAKKEAAPAKKATTKTAHKKAPAKEIPKGLKKILSSKAIAAKYAHSDVDLERDSHRHARAFGKRKSKNGKTYYEYRANRADVRSKYPLLKDGGEIDNDVFATFSSDNVKQLASLEEEIKKEFEPEVSPRLLSLES